MSASPVAERADASHSTTPEATTLELKVPKLRSDKTESKYKHQLKRSRDASDEALAKYRKVSQTRVPAESSSQQQHATEMIEAAITVLQTQRDEASLRVQSLETTAEKANRNGLSNQEILNLEFDIREWTKVRTKQEELLRSANAHKASTLEQLSDLPWDKCQSILEILLCTPIIQMRRSRPSQAQWRKAALQYYDASRVHEYDTGLDETKMRENQVWDPIIKRWLNASQVKAAHILPYSLTNEAVRVILGENEDSDIIFDIRNCLPLWAPLELAFDKGVFVLVPATKVDDGPTNYKLILLEEQMRNVPVSPLLTTWGELDGTILEFRNNCRPRQRYMYLNFVSRIITARKLKYSKYSRERLATTGTAWVSPGKWIRKSLIREVARIVGDHQVPDMLDEGAFEDDDRIGPDTPTKANVTKVAEEWVTDVFAREMFKEDSDEMEGGSDEECTDSVE